jgi:hypothetical protein
MHLVLGFISGENENNLMTTHNIDAGRM